MIDFNAIGSNEKQKNILMILDRIVTDQGVSATDIARATGLSFATISRALAALRQAQLVTAAGKEITDMGRHPDIFGLNPEYGCLLHFHVDAELLHACLSDFNGGVLRTHECAVGRDLTSEGFGSMLRGCAEELTGRKKNAYKKIMAAGIAIPGLVDEKNKVVKRIPNFSNLKNANLFRVAGAALDMPVVINNEARLCAVGEYIQGGREKNNIVYVDFTKYSGIGAGVLLNGSLFSGKNGFAGEIGDMLVDIRNYENGYREDEGCLEAMAGVAVMFDKLLSLVRRGRAGILKELMVQEETDTLTLRMIEEAVLMQDLDVMDVFDETMKMWAIAVINLSALLDPDLILLGGAVSVENDVVLARIRHYVSKVLYYDVNIAAVAADDKSQLFGGLYMLQKFVFNHIIPERLFAAQNG